MVGVVVVQHLDEGKHAMKNQGQDEQMASWKKQI